VDVVEGKSKSLKIAEQIPVFPWVSISLKNWDGWSVAEVEVIPGSSALFCCLIFIAFPLKSIEYRDN
jgi:hypothetical protein